MNAKELINQFKEVFGYDQGVRVFEAPARVNLIGEHIDYNGGNVFPAALTIKTMVAAAPRKDAVLRVAATTLPGIVVQSPYSLLSYMKGRSYGAYQFGVADELLKANYPLIGADLLFWGDIPFGSGLSSSASIEVATAFALATLGLEAKGSKAALNRSEIAQVAQRAENNFVGVNCGIMDQFASANGKEDHAILLDCATLKFEHIPLALHDYSIVITNTNKPHNLIESKYNERRQECEEALADLRSVFPDLQYLCALTPQQFHQHAHVITRGEARKRARHAVEEQHRVMVAVEALKNDDLDAFGKLMTASHISLRDLYEVTGRELDVLNDAALQVEGVLGSRMTGAGFGGCIVSLVKTSCIDQFKAYVSKQYTKETGYVPTFIASAVGDGAKEVLQ